MSFADLRLPKPLLSPDAWPSGDELLISASSLEWGGAFEARLRAAKSITAEISSDMKADASFVLLQERAREFAAEVRFVEALGGHAISSSDCAEAVFPESFGNLSEHEKRRLLEAYKKQLGAETLSLMDLRYFAGFLRRDLTLAPEVLDFAALEWARFAVFTSPQSDLPGDSVALTSETELILNPTLEIPPRLEKNAAELLAVFRVHGLLFEQTLGWQEAVVIDELRENGRVRLSNLVEELEGKSFALHKSFSFKEVAATMIARGLLFVR